jgi:hypothetical protein
MPEDTLIVFAGILLKADEITHLITELAHFKYERSKFPILTCPRYSRELLLYV